MSQVYPIILIKLREDINEVGGARPVVMDIRVRAGNLRTVNMFIKLLGNFLRAIFHNRRFRILGVADFSDNGGDVLYVGQGKIGRGSGRYRTYKSFGAGVYRHKKRDATL